MFIQLIMIWHWLTMKNEKWSNKQIKGNQKSPNDSNNRFIDDYFFINIIIILLM